ncbi:hypothetical protein BGZ72_007806 [Mortierella alpina]|nr:hypothetical protein BGZ72_007806 [Mortierella alpina]
MADDSYVIVRDEQGRRRFHGAFTGGFSAGYYNTVGSKEGWTPSEFVSSRDKRSEKKTAKPEDFMDEEDKQASGEMPECHKGLMMADASRLVTTDDFDVLGSTERDLQRKRAAARSMQSAGGILGALPDSMIDDIIIPSAEPVGVRLLKRMGWKPGQGIGPRVLKRNRRLKDGPLSDDDMDVPANVTFAPIDSAIVQFTNKTDHQGLGFDPYKNAPEFDRSLQSQSGSKYLSDSLGTKKAGLKFGTFDDDDEDDDVYGVGPMPLRSMAIDTVLDDQPVARRRHDSDKKQSKTDSQSPMYCSDGRPPLPGFVLAPSAKSVKWYPAPEVPRDFVPHHTFSSSVKPTPPSRGRDQPKLTADDRGVVLGETPIEAPRRSVFEYMSAENKNRLDNILGFVMDTEGEKHMRKNHWEVPTIDKDAAAAALQGFMPFGDNLLKQNRYKQYLNMQAGNSNEKIQLVEGFSGEDMTKELNEFVQAARIFKPLSMSMANRFTSASKVVEFAQPAAGLRSAEEIKAAEKLAPTSQAVERMEVPKSQAAKAAAMGMFGPLTRSSVDFFPSKLLCKRFNVPNPHPDHKDTGPEAAKDLLDKTTMESMMMNRKPGEGMAGDNAGIPASQNVSAGTSEMMETTVQQEEEEQDQVEEVEERPAMDIFKAIFDDSDSDSDSDSTSVVDSDNEDKKKTASQVVVKEDDQEKAAEPENIDPDKPKEPFRPMFTKRAGRSGSAAAPPSTGFQSRTSKLDLASLKDYEDEEDDENEMGPRLAIPKPTATTGRSSTSRKSSVTTGQKGDQTEMMAAPSESLGAPSLSNSATLDQTAEPDIMIGPPVPEKHTRDVGSGTEEASVSSRHDSTRRHESSSSKRHKSSSSSHRSSSRHKSSSSRSERREGHASDSRSRRRSSSRSRRRRRHDSEGDSESEQESDRDRQDKGRGSSSRRHESSAKETSRSDHSASKSHKRHKERRSKSRSRSPKRSSHKSHKDTSRERDKDRHREREKGSKRSRSERHKSSRHRGEDRKEEYDPDEMWVEKETSTPQSLPSASTSQANTPSLPANRPRATAFF